MLARMGGRTRDPARVLRALDGRATWQQLERLCTQHALRSALAQGTVVRARRGLYVLPDLSPPRLAAARLNGVLSHLSAAVELGWPVLVAPTEVHVTVPRAAPTHGVPGSVVLHRADLPERDRRRVATRPLRTVVDCAVGLPFAQALAVADSALRDGTVYPEELHEAAGRRRGPGASRLRPVAEAADDNAANPFESGLRAAVLEAGVTGFVPQQPVRLRSGLVIHVDLGDPVLRIAIEADSFTHHGGRRELREDCRRYDELVRAGWLVLRFAWEHVMFDAPWVGSLVRDVVTSARATSRAA
jgi:very-short-patch-repair endonuclease